MTSSPSRPPRGQGLARVGPTTPKWFKPRFIRSTTPTRARSDGPSASHRAVHLLRHVLAPHQPTCRRDGTLPRAKPRAVVEYLAELLQASLTQVQLAAVAHLSVDH